MLDTLHHGIHISHNINLGQSMITVHHIILTLDTLYYDIHFSYTITTGLPRFLQEILCVLQIEEDSFLPHPFHFIIH